MSASDPRSEMFGLSELLAPAQISDFLTAATEQKWLRVPGKPQRFETLMTFQTLDELLRDHLNHFTFPALRIAFDGRVLPESAITSLVADQRSGTVRRFAAQKIREQLARGGTLILSSVEQYLPQVRALARLLTVELGELVQANAYFSPGGSPGFQMHYDGHDVIVLQLEGEKEWHLFGVSYRSPLESQSYLDHAPPQAVAERITLKKGEALYLPRGYWHSAIAQPGVGSLHLSLGIHRDTRLDFLAWLVDQLKQDASMREDMASALEPASLAETVVAVRAVMNRTVDELPQLADAYDRWRRERNVVGERLIRVDPTR